MSQTPLLGLPYLAAGQSQKHVTINESLRWLDALVHLAVASRSVTTPPGAPADGARYLVPAGAGEPWSAHANEIAAYLDGGWSYLSPQTGWRCWVADEQALLVFSGIAWMQAGGSGQNLPMIGINTTADSVNRLAISSPATLFNHEGQGHQLKVNKAGSTQNASLLFQTGFSGRAEIGTTGSDNLSLKVSPDGAGWTTVATLQPNEIRFTAADSSGVCNIGPHTLSTSMLNGSRALAISAGITGDRYAYFDFNASAANAAYSTRVIRYPGQDGAFEIDNAGAGSLRLSSAAGKVALATGGVERLAISAGGHVVPGTDNAVNLGQSSARFIAVWAVNGVIQTSDKRDKRVESTLGEGQAGQLVDSVKPVLFRWKSAETRIEVADVREQAMNEDNPHSGKISKSVFARHERSGQRLHAGFLAQDVRKAMRETALDCAIWGLDDPGDEASRQWLNPSEMIPVLWAALRETRRKLDALERAREKR